MIEWAVAAKALDGEERSGDTHMVRAFAGGMLMAAIDGLGHGVEAGAAADVAATVLETHAGEPVDGLVRRCHEKLIGTRGVAMTVASFNAADGVMSCLAVGNVAGLLVRWETRPGSKRESFVLRGGVVGYRLPRLISSALHVAEGDTVILATDGIRPEFANVLGERLDDAPGPIAERILAGFRRGSDDALVLVARIAGVSG